MPNGSRTLLGLLIAAVPNIANLLGFDVSPEFSEQASIIIDSVITVIGLLIALYGRIKAQGPLWFAKKSK